MRMNHMNAFRVVSTTVVAAVSIGMANPAAAQQVVTGNIAAAFADPSDFVVDLGVAGPCGSKFFHIQRTSVNFKEMVAVELTAFSTSKPLIIFMKTCIGDRNIISHGYVSK